MDDGYGRFVVVDCGPNPWSPNNTLGPRSDYTLSQQTEDRWIVEFAEWYVVPGSRVLVFDRHQAQGESSVKVFDYVFPHVMAAPKGFVFSTKLTG